MEYKYYLRIQAVMHDGLEIIGIPIRGYSRARVAVGEDSPRVLIGDPTVPSALIHKAGILHGVPLVPPHVASILTLNVVPVHGDELVPVRALLLMRHPQDVE